MEALRDDALAYGEKAVNKYYKDKDAARSLLESALDKYKSMYKNVDKDIDVSGTKENYGCIQELVGITYYNEKAYKLAAPLIKAAAEEERPRALIYQAETYIRNRKGMPDTPGYLKDMLDKALADKDIFDDCPEELVKAYMTLAKIYRDGIGVKKNPEEMFRYYMKAAQMEEVEAFALVGQCYMYGEGVKKDGKRAFEWNEKAAQAGNDKGIRNYAVCFDFGTGTKKNAEQAIHWYKELLNHMENDRFAMYRIAVCLCDPDREYGVKPTDEMYKEAYSYAEKALSAGEENANYIIGYCYMKGKAVKVDYNKAVAHFTKASNVGNTKAKAKLALFVKNGAGKYTLK